MRVLVTGVAGFAGAHLLQHLMENTDWEIVGVDSLMHRGDIRRIDDILEGNPDYKYRFTFIKRDLAAKEGWLGLPPCHYVLNLASESHVDRSISEPAAFVHNNVDLMINMLEYARWCRPLKFIHISTDEVYGVAPGETLHKEWAPILPSNPYSASKAAQEALAISYWRTYGLPLIITNCMNMFGERQDTEKYVPMLIKQIKASNKVTVHGDKEHGIGSRFYLHARNHADALLFLLENHEPAEWKDGNKIITPSRFNVAGDIELDNLEMAQLIAQFIGKRLKYELADFHATRPGHDRRYGLDGHKLHDLGWNPPIRFMDSLEKTVKWSLKHKEWLV